MSDMDPLVQKDLTNIMDLSLHVSPKARHRNFVFTHNNYSDTTLEDTLACRYIIYGREVSKSGTPHLQGFVIFAGPKTLSSVIKNMPGCHIEVAITVTAAVKYCKKDEAFTERGVPPVSKADRGEAGRKAEQGRWKRIRVACEAGQPEDIPEYIRFKFPKLIAYHRQNFLRKRKLDDTECNMEWYHGPTGTGKSRKAREDHPDAFLKPCNKWWDGYEDEETVIIEDFDISHSVLAHHIKIWADRYPFPAEIKGGMFKIRPKRIIITSNYAPEDIWSDAPNTLGPVLRRFKKTHFPDLSLFNVQPENVVN